MTVVNPTTTPRRDVLCGLIGLLAPGALVAACGSNPTPTDVGGPVLAALSDVPDGSGLVVDKPGGGKLLLVRAGQEVKAYDGSCTHKGTTLDPPTAGTITCPKHGAQFDAMTGSVKKGPAQVALAIVPVAVRGGKVVLS